MPRILPETLEDALAEIEKLDDEIEEMQEEIDELTNDLEAAQAGRNEAQSALDNLQGEVGLQDAAEALIAETSRPVGDINAIILPDTPAARRALRALSDAAGKTI